MFNTLKYTIDNTVRLTLLESKLDSLLAESSNPAFYSRKNKAENLRQLWAEVEEKQKSLQDMVFGSLSNGLEDLTIEKAKVMGEKYLQIPKTICRAGNKKLPPSVLMINMSSSLMCPSFYLGTCFIDECRCYAQRAENQYTSSTLPDRWKTDLMHTQMLRQYQNGNKLPYQKYFELVETYINIANTYCDNIFNRSLKRMERKLGRPLTEEERQQLYVQKSKYRITDVRLNETGDFHCQTAVDLWSDFAKKIKDKYGINTHTYTARYLDFSKAVDNMAVNASHGGIKVGNDSGRRRMFKAVEDEKYNALVGGDKVVNQQPVLGYDTNNILHSTKYFYKCPCTAEESTCNRCGVCFQPNKTGKFYIIVVRYHGQKNAQGLKNLFTKEEMQPIINKMINNGWVSKQENGRYNGSTREKQLDALTQKINKQRQNSKQNK